MSARSLFGHLVGRFARHPENLATEALHYILTNSLPAREAFLQVGNTLGVSLSPDLYFRTQAAADDGAISDLVGRRPDGSYQLVVEAKFWASLTRNQPSQYLEMLSHDNIGLLLLVASRSRLHTLWAECLRRLIQEQGLDITEERGLKGGSFRAQVGAHMIGMVS